MLDRNKERILPSHSDPKQLANEFNDYYVEKIKKIRESIPNESSAIDYSRNFDGDERLGTFAPTSVDELNDIIEEFGLKTSVEDPIPCKVLQTILDIALPVFVDLINKSFAMGSMEGVKQSVIDPLLKKAGLDIDNMKNYRPVNNLIFFSKLIERVVLKRLDQHMMINGLHEDTQFGYKKHHSTETCWA